MNVAGLCSICGEPASRMHTCHLCGNITCEKCSSEDICVQCIDKRLHKKQ